MLTVEYLQEYNLYLVIPVLNGRESEDTEYVFHNVLEAKNFIDCYYKNPCLAHFAYTAANFQPTAHETNACSK